MIVSTSIATEPYHSGSVTSGRLCSKGTQNLVVDVQVAWRLLTVDRATQAAIPRWCQTTSKTAMSWLVEHILTVCIHEYLCQASADLSTTGVMTVGEATHVSILASILEHWSYLKETTIDRQITWIACKALAASWSAYEFSSWAYLTTFSTDSVEDWNLIDWVATSSLACDGCCYVLRAVRQCSWIQSSVCRLVEEWLCKATWTIQESLYVCLSVSWDVLWPA